MTVLSFAVFGFASIAGAQAITEGFEDIGTLPAQGWDARNNSNPVGSTTWFQGSLGTQQSPLFGAQSGSPTSYIAANFNSTTGTNTISTWLFAPTRTLRNGDVITFYTRTVTASGFPDRLEVRLSTNGTSTNVGTTATSVGDFTNLLLSVNEGLNVGGYPDSWTQFTITLSGLPAAGVSGRVAFRYFVTDGGPTGDNSNYIGIDTFTYTPVQVITATDAVLDYNGDNRTDYVVVRNTGGGANGQLTWFVNDGTTNWQRPWGLATDFPLGGDYDGDNKDDLAVYRPAPAPNSYFYILQSQSNTLLARELGSIGDDPTVVGDYDGDNKDDMAVFRSDAGGGQSYWYYRPSTAPTGIVFVPWGRNGDTPVPGDFDGDNKNDFCVQRDGGNGQGVFLLAEFDGGRERVIWGTPTDDVAPGDYDGDGKTDFAVVRNQGGQLLWSVLGRNNNNVIHFLLPWGRATDEIAHGDYDGDGKTDPTVWRPNADPTMNFFIIRRSSDSTERWFEWGQQNDYPVANYNVH